jgi:hypothetical protein
MIAKRFSDFLMYQLLESILVTDKEFKDTIEEIDSEDHIADVLFGIIDSNKDIKTNYNYLSLSPDKNDEIRFLPDTQYQRFLKAGDDLESKTKSTVLIGRMTRQILKDAGQNFTDSDIEKFVNSFKSVWDKKHAPKVLKIVKGEEILKWYNEENYESNKGTL